MSTKLAMEYADDLAKQYREWSDAGTPFGINEETEEEDGALDYLADVLDINFLLNADRTYKAVRILVSFGGPNAWIDTRTGQLEVSWWSEVIYRDLPKDFIDGIDDALDELWEC